MAAAFPHPCLLGSQSGRSRGDTILQKARSAVIDAQGSDVNLVAVVVGAKQYYRTLRYQMRELVDLRKMEYEPSKGLVWWLDHKPPQRERFIVNEFLDGMAEYQMRLSAWGGEEESQALHRTYGHMAKQNVRKTAAMIGGMVPPHGTRCPCSRCGDWERVALDESEPDQRRPKPSVRRCARILSPFPCTC